MRLCGGVRVACLDQNSNILLAFSVCSAVQPFRLPRDLVIPLQVDQSESEDGMVWSISHCKLRSTRHGS